jgi:hypothetical protein
VTIPIVPTQERGTRLSRSPGSESRPGPGSRTNKTNPTVWIRGESFGSLQIGLHFKVRWGFSIMIAWKVGRQPHDFAESSAFSAHGGSTCPVLRDQPTGWSFLIPVSNLTPGWGDPDNPVWLLMDSRVVHRIDQFHRRIEPPRRQARQEGERV